MNNAETSSQRRSNPAITSAHGTDSSVTFGSRRATANDTLRYVHFIAFRVTHSRGDMYIGHGRMCVCVSVCLSLAAFPHYCMDPDVTWGNGKGCPLYCSCALFDGFAIGARVSLL